MALLGVVVFVVVVVAGWSCSRVYQTPDFSTADRTAIADALEQFSAELDETIVWASSAICEIGVCPVGSSAGEASCMGDPEEAAEIRYAWLSCLTTPVLAASEEPASEGSLSVLLACRPANSEAYERLIARSGEGRARWLREQLSLVDDVRERLKREFPSQISRFDLEAERFRLRISALRARYQSDMQRLRASKAPGEVIGTWEDRYQASVTDLDAVEDRLDELGEAVRSLSDVGLHRFTQAAVRIASSGFAGWKTPLCDGSRQIPGQPYGRSR